MPKKLTIPKTTNAKINLLERVRKEKKKHSDAYEQAKSDEKLVTQSILADLRKLKTDTFRNDVYHVTKSMRQRVQAVDWEKIWGYVREHDAFEILPKYAPKMEAVAEREGTEMEVPGVEIVETETLSVRAVKK